MADSIDEIFGPDADPDELRAFYEAIGLSMEYDCNTREMSVEIALGMTMPTSKNEVGVAHGVRGECRSQRPFGNSPSSHVDSQPPSQIAQSIRRLVNLRQGAGERLKPTKALTVSRPR